jgi:hypothetical protein
MKFDWLEFCRLVRHLPEVVSCDDEGLHRMLVQPVPPSRHTDDIGRPLPGSSLITEHPDLPNYRRVMDIRYRGCVDEDDKVGVRYFGQVVGFLESRSQSSRLQIVCLSTERECYEILYFADEAAVLLCPVRHLEGRNIERV